MNRTMTKLKVVTGNRSYEIRTDDPKLLGSHLVASISTRVVHQREAADDLVAAYNAFPDLAKALAQIADTRGWATWRGTAEAYVSSLATVAAFALAKAKGAA
jgi:hypothetical protein